ncbi:MAG: diphthamide biosynthesis enzyme Dph2 [Candidatus Micrarchaeota archaeon]
MRILLQFPEGLKQRGFELMQKYQSEGHEVFLSASACYGACDISLDEARWIKADKIVHFGHNKFVRSELEIPIEYVPYTIDLDLRIIEEFAPKLKEYKTIAILTTVQNIHQMPQIKEIFANNGITVLTETGFWAREPGQVLGCDALSIKKLESRIEAVLYIGDGMFHPLAIESKKPVYIFNPTTKEFRAVNKDIELLHKRRKASIIKAVDCKRFAILVSTKVGQFNLGHAEYAKRELEKRGKQCAILVANELEPITVNNFLVFDCYVNTACPRIVDDTVEFGKPILNIDGVNQVCKILDELDKNSN